MGFNLGFKGLILSNIIFNYITVLLLYIYGLDGPGMESRWGARFSAPVQTGPRAHPASYTMGTVSFPGIKRQGRGVDHPPPSSAEVKERTKLYFYSISGPSWPLLGWTLPLPLLLYMSLRNKSDLCVTVSQVFLFAIDGVPCFVLPVIVSQLFSHRS